MDRQEHILVLARRQGRVLVDSLAEELGVSSQTIRRDINLLCEEGKLRRLHGGAEFIGDKANLPYHARAVLNYEAKNAIASAVARMVPDGATLFISVGTTPAVVAAAMAEKNGLTIITNNLNAAMALSESSQTRIIIPGGELRLPDRDLLSEDAVALFGTYRADFGIYGIGGIDTDGSLLDFNESEVRARENMRQNSRTSILVADHSKFGRSAVAIGGHLRDADHVVTDILPEQTYCTMLQERPGQLVIARQSTESSHDA